MPYIKDPNSDDVIWVDDAPQDAPAPAPTTTSRVRPPMPTKPPSEGMHWVFDEEDNAWSEVYNGPEYGEDSWENVQRRRNNPTPTPTPTPGTPRVGDRRDVPGGSYIEEWDGTKWVRYDRPGSGRDGGTGSTGGTGGTGYPDWKMSPYGGGGGPYNFPMLSLPDMPTLPTLERYEDFVPESWKAPAPSDIYSDPSYQFRFSEGMRPIETSRAAQGLTRTGATLKALSRYGQNFASNEYDRIYNRAADSYDRTNSAKYQAWAGNRQNRLDAYDRSRSNVLDTYDRTVNKARDEFAPRMKWAELQYNRDWDVYKYQNDDEYRKWAKKGDWNNALATNYRPD